MRLTPGRRTALIAAALVAVSLLMQTAPFQDSDTLWFAVVADLAAPAWALGIIPIAGLLHRAAAHGGPLANADSVLATRLTKRRVAEWCARASQAGAVLIVGLAWTREWERFGERPGVAWFVAVILITLVLLVIPLWWIRGEIHRRGVQYLDHGRLPARIARFLFSESEGRPARWAHILAFAVVTSAVAFVLLGQLDSLLRGMHLPEDPSVGISALPGINEFDLSAKPAAVVERVAVWRDYTEAVGARFGSAHGVVTVHAVIDTLVTIPSYLALGVVLAFVAWRRRLRFGAGTDLRRAFELVVMGSLVVLLATAVLDIGRNVLTWFIMDRAWNGPEGVTNAGVRMLWGFSLGRTIALALLGSACLLLLALAETGLSRLRGALVAVRSEVLSLTLFGVVILMMPQTADVIRGWHVSHVLITTAITVVLAMLVRWTAVRNLRLQHSHWQMVQAGTAPEPHRVRVPLAGSRLILGSAVGAGVVLLAVLQCGLDAAGIPVGRGLLIPAALTMVLWLFGLALPAAPYRRGDRPVPRQVRRRVPRMIGSAVLAVVGFAVLKAAATSVGYAGHADWWLVLALMPPAIGIWRIATRTTSTMGWLEAGFAIVTAIVAATMLAAGDPEFSPTGLVFAGVTFVYGSLAFFNSYERVSLVNRVSERFLPHRLARPFVAGAGVALVGTIVWFYLDPIAVGPRIGTVGMAVLAAMVLSAVGATAVRLSEHTTPPRLLCAFGIKRTPVVTLVLLWMLLAPAVVDQRVDDVQVIDATATGGPIGFDDVWQRWSAANLQGAEASPDGEVRIVPLLLVSSSGGGLRASVWTSYVLDCIFESEPGEAGPCAIPVDRESPLASVALMSGVSGGSLGLSAYVTHLLDGVDGTAAPGSWVEEVFGDDYMAAPLGWLFFADLPRSLFGYGTNVMNRSELIERGWESSWPADVPGLRRGLFEVWEADETLPALVFNGTSVLDGCRVNVSVLDADGGSPDVPACAGNTDEAGKWGGAFAATYDLVDFLCPGDDVPLSTAVGISARVPVVSVAARVASRTWCGAEGSATVFVVDGGYLEGSGAGTLLDGWEAIRDDVEQYNTSNTGLCIVPVMVHIDNGYESPGVVGDQAVPREFLVPLQAVASTQSGITAARAEAALTFEAPFTVGGADVTLVERTADGDVPIDGRYVRLVTKAHPGVQAPLGWALSQASMDDLRDQLAIEENAAALDEVRRWLDGELYCAGG